MSLLNGQTKRQISLLAGDDLEGPHADEARGYVETCPDCRRHWTRVRGCLDVIQRTEGAQRTDAGARPVGSLWPTIEGRLGPTVVPRPEPRFNGWIPAFSMAAACAAVVAVAVTNPAGESNASRWPTSAGMSAAGGSAVTPVQFDEAEPRPYTRLTDQWVRRTSPLNGFGTVDEAAVPNDPR